MRIILILAAMVVFFNADGSDRLVEAERFYQAAIKYTENGDFDSAIVSLKNALKFNKKMAKAYHQLGLIYLKENTVSGRLKATFEIERALRLEPENLEFRFSQAVLELEKGMLYNAMKKFQKIVKDDPKNYEAYIYLADIKEKEVLHYQNMISIEPNSSGIIYLNQFAEEFMEETADYYRKAIALSPDLPDVYYRLALLFYEFKNYPEMVQLLESAVKINPNDKNSRLFLGFAYQNVRKFEQALQQYDAAKQLMSVSEKELMESIDFILTPEEQKQYRLKTASAQKFYATNFWKQKEPFYLSPVNERLLEHYSRIAYANLRFSRHKAGKEGWETDLGKVFIRFGHPQQKYRTRPYIGELQDNTRNPLVHSREVWIYPDFEMKFEDEYLSGDYTFARDIVPEFDYKMIYEDKIKQNPDYFQMYPDSMLFDVPYEIVAFKDEKDRTELELCYCLPANQIHLADFETHQYELKKGLFLFNNYWNLRQQQKGDLAFNNNQLIEIDSKQYFSSHDKVVVPPGEYNFALEFEDKISQKRFAVHQKILADTFFVDRFQISDVLFACDIEPPYSSNNVSRDNFKISPNPLRIYRAGKPVVIYFEIYNLTHDQSGNTHYQIEYSVGSNFQSEPGWKKILNNIGLIKRKGEVSTSYKYSGENAKEIHYQHLGLEPNSVGKIKLKITITDLISKEKLEKLELFTVKK